MKRLILFATIICLPVSLLAQEEWHWTSVFIEADSSGKPFEILDTIYVPLFPDSNIINGVNSYKGCPLEKQHNLHGIGQSFDFQEHEWTSFDHDDWFVDGVFDSLIINYRYHRTSSSVKNP